MSELVDESGKDSPWKNLQLFTSDPYAISAFVPLDLLPPNQRPEEFFANGLALHRFDLERTRTATDGSSVRCEGRLHIFKDGSHEQMLLVQNFSTKQYYQVTDKQWGQLVPQTEDQNATERAELNRRMLGAI